MLASCSSGSYILTGTQKEAKSPENVVLYTSAPSEYEVIGIVKATGTAGWTEQDEMDYAVARLKKLAAKLGANGVLLASGDVETTTTIHRVGDSVQSSDSQTIVGQAIFVAGE